MNPNNTGNKVVELRGVSIRRGRKLLLDGIYWKVLGGQRWVILGANGAGKTTLLKNVHGEMFPTQGSTLLFGEPLGQVDLRQLRRRVGLTGNFLEASFRAQIKAAEVVLSAKNAAREVWWHRYGRAERARAAELLELVGCGGLVEAQFGDCSSGERQRILIARALMPEPDILILDEPMANLDIVGREQLLGILAEPGGLSGAGGQPAASSIFSAKPDLTTLYVAHHLEEIPSSTTHLLMLKDGKVVVAGEISEVLTEANLELCLGIKLNLERRHGRWHCWTGKAG